MALVGDSIAKQHNVPQAMFHALILVESNYKEDAVNKSAKIRSYGLTQLTLATAKRFCGLTKKNIMDPLRNMECGARVLRYQIERYKGNLKKALSAYNAGTYTPKNTKYVKKIYDTISLIYAAQEVDVD
jgi:soluble lytic murein transglycosylase-like protein